MSETSKITDELRQQILDELPEISEITEQDLKSRTIELLGEEVQ